jgi:hypothetical protein
MKQITIYCSTDLEDRVTATLDRAGVEGYLQLGGASGSRFRPLGEVPRTLTFEATAFLVPGVEDWQVRSITSELARYGDECEIRPCLRVVVSAVEEVY